MNVPTGTYKNHWPSIRRSGKWIKLHLVSELGMKKNSLTSFSYCTQFHYSSHWETSSNNRIPDKTPLTTTCISAHHANKKRNKSKTLLQRSCFMWIEAHHLTSLQKRHIKAPLILHPAGGRPQPGLFTWRWPPTYPIQTKTTGCPG
jgi:hypothetical protein